MRVELGNDLHCNLRGCRRPQLVLRKREKKAEQLQVGFVVIDDENPAFFHAQLWASPARGLPAGRRASRLPSSATRHPGRSVLQTTAWARLCRRRWSASVRSFMV